VQVPLEVEEAAQLTPSNSIDSKNEQVESGFQSSPQAQNAQQESDSQPGATRGFPSTAVEIKTEQTPRVTDEDESSVFSSISVSQPPFESRPPLLASLEPEVVLLERSLDEVVEESFIATPTEAPSAPSLSYSEAIEQEPPEEEETREEESYVAQESIYSSQEGDDLVNNVLRVIEMLKIKQRDLLGRGYNNEHDVLQRLISDLNDLYMQYTDGDPIEMDKRTLDRDRIEEFKADWVRRINQDFERLSSPRTVLKVF
jgi:hypothetical protein